MENKVELPILQRLQDQNITLSALQGVQVDFARERGNLFLNKMGMAFRRWCKQRKIEKPPTTWNLGFIGRAEKNTVYPCLDSNVKAAHTKPILFFLNQLAAEVASHCSCFLLGLELRA